MSPPDGALLFSADHAEARARFRSGALAIGARLDCLPLAVSGPDGEALAIDIAWLGSARPRSVLLHVSGLHGIEGFAGSAIQLALLRDVPPMPRNGAIVLVHVLNPFGMAWLRRVNEHNVDLNRNFLARDEIRTGASPIYRALDPLLNPPSPPRRDLFLPKIAARALRHGPTALKQAIAEGQYEFERGLFYGGSTLEPGPRSYLEWLARHLSIAEYVLAIDVHTGLGPWTRDTVIREPGACTTAARDLRFALDRVIVEPDLLPGVAYTVSGSHATGLRRTLEGAALDVVTEEFGTFPALAVLAALRDENRWHHHGGGTPGDAVRRRLLETFCPPETDWRRRVVAQGTELARRAAHFAFTRH